MTAWMSAYPVKSILTASGRVMRAWARKASPLIPGIRWSERITWTSSRPQDLQGRVAVVGGQDPIVAEELMPEGLEQARLVVGDQQRVPSFVLRHA